MQGGNKQYIMRACMDGALQQVRAADTDQLIFLPEV